MIAEIAVSVEVNQSFDYDAGDFPFLKRGMRVWIDFNNRRILGIVLDIKDKKKASFKLKPVLKVLDSSPSLPEPLLKLSESMSKRYLYSKGEMLRMMLPLSLRKKRLLEIKGDLDKRVKPGGIKTVYIREDIKDSVRFDYYSKAIKEALLRREQAIICLPQKDDILRTRKLLSERLQGVDIGELYSLQRSSEQLEQWVRMRQGDISVCVGTRQAVFAPFVNLGLIIIDKESFYGYFQPEKPFYHLRDLAFMRAKNEGLKIILHSDCPSIEGYRILKRKNAESIDLFKEKKPKINIFDLHNYKFKRYPVLSGLSLEITRKYLDKGKKVIVFWNRKGFAYLLKCSHCGEILKCPNCESFMSFSLDKKSYICNHCGKKLAVLKRCNKCNKGYIRNIGVGTERAVSNFRKFFPGRKIFMLSKDQPEYPQDWDMLIATEKLVYSKNIPFADLVIVSGIDSLLSRGDYSSGIEVFSILSRLENLAEEEMAVFTFHPGYYPIKAVKRGWEWFYKRELKERKSLQLPPYFHLAKVSFRQKSIPILIRNISRFKEVLEEQGKKHKDFYIYDFVKSYPFKEGGNYHYYLLVKSKSMALLKSVIKKSLCKFRKSSAKISLEIK